MNLAELVARASVLTDRRRILGITGAPGAGKSTLAAQLVAALPAGAAVLVPMDGFHLADVQLAALGLRSIKGAPETFDSAGYVALLRRLAEPTASGVVYAPEFRREIEEPIAGAIAVSASVPLVVTEGNYLLLDSAPWAEVRGLLDEAWFMSVDPDVRLSRLIARHESFGRSSVDARDRAAGSDQRNAELIEATRARADLVIEA
jgi:pantothenate kinase